MDTPSLTEQFSRDETIVAPGVFDALSAANAAQAGFSAAYISGASIAYCRFGRPDIGLVSMSEVAGTLSDIRERVDIPLIIDADTGFGNAINVQRTVKLFERNGANCIQIEDQTMPKRCGHLKGKGLVSTAEAVGKIKAAVDARANEGTLIMSRTDAIAVEGFDAALERAERYLEAGGFTPMFDTQTLTDFGYRIVIFPGGLVRARTLMEKELNASGRLSRLALSYAGAQKP